MPGPVKQSNSGKPGERGFTMIEIALVLTITLILVAVAVPTLMNSIYSWKITGAATDLSGFIQQARITAEKQNTTLPVYVGTVETNAQGAFLGTSGSTWAAGEPDMPFAAGVTLGNASNTPAVLNPGFNAEAAGTTLYFSGRGLPVKASGNTYIPSNGVIFYLTDTNGDWAAVSVTGTGRSKMWRWNGSWH